MPGKVVKVLVKGGQSVTLGQPLVVMEAMKMEHTVVAPCDGFVEGTESLHVGGQVEDRQVLLRVVAEPTTAAAAAPASLGAAASAAAA
jgi:acetyl/propionyl-CoA carboxylase alpha subunit